MKASASKKLSIAADFAGILALMVAIIALLQNHFLGQRVTKVENRKELIGSRGGDGIHIEGGQGAQGGDGVHIEDGQGGRGGGLGLGPLPSPTDPKEEHPH